MTFDRKKEARRLEFLNNFDILLDFHNFEEFQNKINFYLKRKINEKRYYSENDNIQIAYMQLYSEILKVLMDIDYKEYSKYLQNYSLDLSSLEKISSDMLTEYANYIIPITNNTVSFETILNAAKVVKEKINNYSNEQINEWLKETIARNEEVDTYTLPYLYDPQNKKEGYLKDHPKSKIKRLK